MHFDMSALLRRSRLLTSGHSSPGGFRVSLQHRRLTSLKAKVKLRTYGKEPYRPWKFIGMLVGYYTASHLWSMLPLGNGSASVIVNLAVGALGAMGAGMLCGVVAMRLLENRTNWQWHACEHKAIMMVRSQTEPTMENLRRTDHISPFCGSVLVFLLGTILMAHSLVAASPVAAYLALTSCLSALYVLLFVRSGRASWSTVDRVTYGLALPALMAGMVFQRLVVMRPPTEEQLARTLRFLRFCYRHHPWLAGPKLRRNPVFRRFVAYRPRTARS